MSEATPDQKVSDDQNVQSKARKFHFTFIDRKIQSTRRKSRPIRNPLFHHVSCPTMVNRPGSNS